MDNLRKDVKLISDRINFYKSLQIEDPFKIELQLMEDLPEQYSDYPWLIKTLCKSSDTTWLNKMMSSLTSVVNGEKNLTTVEFELGTELKKQFVDPLIKKN